jgi:UDP-N-acetylmuramate dehydrogenase
MMPALRNRYRGELLYNEPLARYTTWRVGGHARQFYRPVDAQDLAQFLAELPNKEPILWLGLGSNLLVRDGGFPGTVIALQGRLAEIHITGQEVHVGAGAACAKIARECARAGLSGASFLAGIPGTMGGALAMNAGAFGGETWSCVSQVEVVNRAGELRLRQADEYQVAYREVNTPAEEGFVACTLRLSAGDVGTEQTKIRNLLDKRATTQPTGQPSGGSTFRNPEGDYAARLIEASGLKGYRIGGAVVSAKHANFVLNTGNATAADIEALILHMQAEVERQQGVHLQAEVKIVGGAA